MPFPLRAALAASLAIAAVSTLGDFVWATWISEHLVVYGLLHGGLLFLLIGFVFGALAGRPAKGAVSGLLLGVGAAGTFYLLFPLVGYTAMFLVWVGLWMALAALYGHLAGAGTQAATVAARGAIAAVASGLGFYLISGIWRPFDPQGLDYLVHFGAWTIAYLPGFAALLIARA